MQKGKRRLSFCLLTLLLGALQLIPLFALSAPRVVLHPVSQTDRIGSVPDLAERQVLEGYVLPWANANNRTSEEVDPSSRIQLTLILKRSPQAEQAFEELLKEQVTPGSAHYHYWLRPQDLGTLYGPTESDVNAIAAWARSQGFTVGSIAPSRTAMNISGTVEQAATAFQTSFSLYQTSTTPRRAPNRVPTIPAAFAPVIEAVAGLSEERSVPLGGAVDGSDSALQSSSSPDVLISDSLGFAVTPADFDVIFDKINLPGETNGASVGGTPQHVAVIDRYNVLPEDITDFASKTGLGAVTKNSTHPVFPTGHDPGTSDSEAEATLDVERVLGTAPGVIVDLVAEDANVYYPASYAVYKLVDPVLSLSFGECEEEGGQATVDQWNSLWMDAAAMGISVFVSSGDSGAAGTKSKDSSLYCDTHGAAAPAKQMLNVNAYCSSQYCTSVGGTEFNDANTSMYWSNSEDPSVASALSYIPEGAWNEPLNPEEKPIVRATGGGVSRYIPRPSWQTGPGVPNNNFRHQPDIAFPAANHNGYYGCFNSNCDAGSFSHFSGTSASAPTMAGVAALLNSVAGSPQGNLNPLIYRLANSSAASTIFHDATPQSSGVGQCTVDVPSMCNNSTPGPTSLRGGLAGYMLTEGYDQVTGWGSLDIANFIKAALPLTASVSLTTTGTVIGASQSISATVHVASSIGSGPIPTSNVQLNEVYTPPGSSSPLSAPLGAPMPLVDGVATFPSLTFAANSYTLIARYDGDSQYESASSTTTVVSVMAQTPSFSVTPSGPVWTFFPGAASGNMSVSLTSMFGYAGPVNLSCAVNGGNASGAPTCSVGPSSVTLAANGTTTTQLTVTRTSKTASLLGRETKSSSGFGLIGTGVSVACGVFCCFIGG